MNKHNEIKSQVSAVTSMLNSFTFDYEGFCKQMTKEHRTLQQSFTRLCIHWLCECSTDEYQYDGRNEASHEIAKALINSQDADFIGNIPMI